MDALYTATAYAADTDTIDDPKVDHEKMNADLRQASMLHRF